MDIILIRHGQKVPSSPDSDAPLAPEGLVQVDHLKDQLAHLNLRPEIYLASKFKRSQHTAARLSDIYPVDALTPKDNTLISEHILETIIDEAKQARTVQGRPPVLAVNGL